MSVCSVATALAIPRITFHHCIQSDNFAFVFHEYFCFKLQKYNNISPLSHGSVCGPRVPAVCMGCADSQQYRLKLVKSVKYWWRCIRNLNFGVICKVCHYLFCHALLVLAGMIFRLITAVAIYIHSLCRVTRK